MLLLACGNVWSQKPALDQQSAVTVRIRLDVAHQALVVVPYLHAVKVVPAQRVRQVAYGETCVAELRCAADDCEVTRVARSARALKPPVYRVGCTHKGHRADGMAVIELDPFPLDTPAEQYAALAYEEGTTVQLSAEYTAGPDGQLVFVKYVVLARRVGKPSRWK